MNFMNHETQLDWRLAGSKEFSLLLKLIFCNSFEVISGFQRPFNQRTRFKTQFHIAVRRPFKQTTSKRRVERKLLHVKMSSGATP